jgi:glycosyltransferase involved in cell wall biosynthesis
VAADLSSDTIGKVTAGSPSPGVHGMASSSAAAHDSTRVRRVVVLVNRLKRGGGAERVAAALATHLPRDRFEVTVVTTRSGNGPLLDTVLAAGVRHVALERRGRFDVRPLWRFVALLRAEHTDIVHAHMFGSNLWGAVLGRLAGVPVIVAHEHTWSYEGQPVRRWLDGNVIGRLADAFVAVSERDRGRMASLEGVPRDKIVVLPNPFLRRPAVRSSGLLPELAPGGGGPVIATVAVLRPQKALEVLLDAFAEVLTAVPDAILMIGGDGERRGALERHARELGIADRVRFLGWWQDVGGLLEAADVAVISSDYEGAPLFALECMAHGAPLVSTDVGNVGELLGDGEGVMLVPRRDPPSMARAITALLLDPQRPPSACPRSRSTASPASSSVCMIGCSPRRRQLDGYAAERGSPAKINYDRRRRWAGGRVQRQG